MNHLYYRQRRSSRRPRSSERFAPFMVLVCVFVLFVLGIQLLIGMKSDKVESEKNKVHLFTVQGSTDYYPWGTDMWTDAHNNAILFEGDKVKTQDGSYAVLEFFDGTRIRMNEETEINLERIESDKKGMYVDVRVTAGEIWVNELETEFGMQVRVLADHLNVTSVGTIYSVELDELDSFVRVVRGEVRVLVADTLIEDAELLDAVSIGVGQQVSVSTEDVENLEARKFVNLLEPVDDYWRVTEWHIWNRGEDDNPTVYIKPEGGTATDLGTEGTQVPSETETEVDLPTVSVTNPSENPFTLNEPQIFLKGEASKDVTKVVVTEFFKDPQGIPYELSKYIPGSGIWNYSASVDAGNLVVGKNRFVVSAFNDDGLVSDPVEIIIIHEVEDTTQENLGEEEEVTDDVTQPDLDPPAEDNIESSSSLTTPSIGSIEGASLLNGNSYSTQEERVVINGIAPNGATKIVVNGFALSLYEAGSPTWTYYAKSDIGTLKTGTNTYSVYAEDADGTKSQQLTFKITKE